MPEECPTCGLDLDGAKHSCSFRAPTRMTKTETLDKLNTLLTAFKELELLWDRVEQNSENRYRV